MVRSRCLCGRPACVRHQPCAEGVPIEGCFRYRFDGCRMLRGMKCLPEMSMAPRKVCRLCGHLQGKGCKGIHCCGTGRDLRQWVEIQPWRKGGSRFAYGSQGCSSRKRPLFAIGGSQICSQRSCKFASERQNHKKSAVGLFRFLFF